MTDAEARSGCTNADGVDRRSFLLRLVGALSASSFASQFIDVSASLGATRRRTAKPRVVDVRAHGAVGDGKTDDTRAIQSAIDAAGHKGSVRAPSGRTFLISKPLSVRHAGLALSLGGSTLKVANGASGPVLRVIAAGVIVQRLRLDGSRGTGGRGNGIEWHRRGGVLRDCRVFAIGGSGVVVNDASASLRCARVSAVDCSSGNGSAVGFYCGSGVLQTRECRAEFCERAGFFFDHSCSASSSLDGKTRRNPIGALVFGRKGGTIRHFVANDDDRWGLLLDSGASYWRCDYVEASQIGLSARNYGGTGIELFAGNLKNRFRQVVARANPGYGLALGNGSSGNRFDRVTCDGRGAPDSDPGIVITSGSARNQIKRAVVVRHSVGLRIGEDNPVPYNANSIDRITTVDCGWGGIRFEYGNGNVIRSARVINCWCADEAFPGAVEFANAVQNNSIGYLNQSYDQRKALPWAKPPPYAVHCSSTARGNRVKGVARGWGIAKVQDESRGNMIRLSG
jgi:hypothetical protein